MPNSHKNELNRDLSFSQQQNRPYLSVIIQSYKTEICPFPNSRTNHTSLSLSQATKQRCALLPTAEQTTPLFHYLELQNRYLPFSQQQNRPHLSVIISSYTTEMCPSPNSRTDHTSLSLSQATQQRYALLPTTEQTIPLCHYPELHNRDIPALLPTTEQTIPLCHYLKLHNRDVPFSQQQNKPHLSVIISSYTTEICPPFSQQQNRPYLSVIISSCDLQGGGANGLLLQNFSLWVVGWLEVGGVIQINGDVDQGYVEFWIHWVVVQSPHSQLPKNTTHTT